MEIDDDLVLWSAPADERADRPLLLVLHGHGLDESVGFDLRHRLPPSLVLAAPRGPLPARGGYGWFALDATFGFDQIQASVDAVLSWLDRQSGYRSVGVLGFSQGSAVAVQCLRARPTAFAYAVLLSGFLSPLPASGDSELVRLRPPVFSGRGDCDTLVPDVLCQLTDRWLDVHAEVTRRVYAGLGHQVSRDELTDVAAFLDRYASVPDRHLHV